VETGRAVMIRYRDGQGVRRAGSGLRIGGNRVLTAAHVAAGTGHTVTLGSSEPDATVLVRSTDPEIDLAVLEISIPDAEGLLPLGYARVNRDTISTIEGCAALGYPAFKKDKDGYRRSVQVNGFIPTAEGFTARPGTGSTAGYLSLKAAGPAIQDQPPLRGGDVEGTPWAGMSGAVAFDRNDRILGVVRHHNPAEGTGTLALTPIDAVDLLPRPDRDRFWAALGMRGQDDLAWAAAEPVEPLSELVERLAGGDLPLVQGLNPYLVGATESNYGTQENAGTDDPYVARTFQNVDARVRASLVPGRMVLLVGPSKTGKTRTAFQAVRSIWPRARLLIPAPKSLATLTKHPRIRSSSDAVVVWLNDLQRFLTGISDPFTPALLTALLSRPGSTVVVATLRTEERARLLSRDDELTREARRVLEDAIEVELGPTSDDPTEQAAARKAYPKQDLTIYGLAEQLAGAPYLLKQYRGALHADPLFYAVIQTAIDWIRVGMPDPISATDLSTLAVDALFSARPDLDPTPEHVEAKIALARTRPEGAGRVAALQTVGLPDRSRGYLPFSYLAAADDGQVGEPRPIPNDLWYEALRRADMDAAFSVSSAAYKRDNMIIAVRASRQAATAGHSGAMFNLGYLLSRRLDPPDLDEARRWYEKAATAGHSGAMVNLGYLLSQRLDPPDLDEARRWYEKAATAGDTDAMSNLGNLFSDRLDPPDLDEARRWYEKAATAGHTDAMFSLGNLFSDRLDPPDLDEARRWYEKAATAGHSHAMCNLGNLLQEQLNPPDLDEARRWYEKAATAGDTDAMHNLGNLLSQRFDPPDLGEARRWYEKAATAGHRGAAHNLGVIFGDWNYMDALDLD
jgi:TPR repeat protein